MAIRAVAKALADCHLDVTVVTTDDDGNDDRLSVPFGEAARDRGVEYRYFPRNIVAYKVSFRAAIWLFRNIRSFDVVHVHAVFSFLSTVAARIAKQAKIPYVVRPLGVLNQWGLQNRRALAKRASLRLIELPLLKSAAAMHYTSEAERMEAVRLPGVEKIRSVVIPLPVEPQPRGDPEFFWTSYPKVRGRRCVLFLSRIDQKKGLELLLDAFAALTAITKNVLLVVAGAGTATYLSELHARAKALGIHRDIVWTGHLAGQEKAATLAAATMFVLPSFSENFGIAAAEALAAGVPVIVSEEVALSRDVETFEAGLVIQRERTELVLAMQRILNEPETAKKFARNGIRLVEERYSPSAVGAAVRSLYESIVNTDQMS